MGSVNPAVASGSASAAPAVPKKGLYGMPELTADEKLELSSVRLPKDHKVKKFNMTYVSDLLGWLETTKSAFETAGVKKYAVMVQKALDWMTPVTRDMLKGLTSIKKPNWEGFKKAPKTIFADAVIH